MSNIKHTVFGVVCCGVASGLLTGMVLTYLLRPSEASVAQNWCATQGGEYYSSFRVRGMCTIPELKGKARIKVGRDTYVFESEVVDYDTGKTLVIARPLANSSKDKPVVIGSYITKGE